MVCRWCGAETPDHSLVCLNCGQAQRPAAGAAGAAFHPDPPIPELAAAGNPGAAALRQNLPSNPDSSALAIDRFNQRHPSAAERPGLWKVIAVIAAVAAMLALASAGTYYFTRRSSSLAQIVAIGKFASMQPHPRTVELPSAASDATLPPSAVPSADAVPAADKPPVAAPIPDPHIALEAASTQAVAASPPVRSGHPLKARSAKPKFKAEFKGIFGQVVATRSYPSKKMRRKAQNLWAREGKILEPDGSIYQPYESAPSSLSPIPGH